jgi:hypothetical protein
VPDAASWLDVELGDLGLMCPDDGRDGVRRHALRDGLDEVGDCLLQAGAFGFERGRRVRRPIDQTEQLFDEARAEHFALDDAEHVVVRLGDRERERVRADAGLAAASALDVDVGLPLPRLDARLPVDAGTGCHAPGRLSCAAPTPGRNPIF